MEAAEVQALTPLSSLFSEDGNFQQGRYQTTGIVQMT